MYELLEDQAEIAEAHDALLATIAANFPEQETRTIGWAAGNWPDCDLQTNGRYWFWSTKHERKSGSVGYLHWFGMLTPPGKSVSISVEVNTTLAGSDRRLAGAFARDVRTNVVYLMHDGGIGGGKPGIGQQAFLQWRAAKAQRPVPIMCGDGRLVFSNIVMPTRGRGATQSAIEYVNSVNEFKAEASELDPVEQAASGTALQEYYDEFSGRVRGKRSAGAIDYVSRHGDIVKALEVWRREQQPLIYGQKIVKNLLIDLGLASKSGTLKEVYEVKTTADRQAVYSAIGQLTVHAAEADCKKILVLPADETIKQDQQKALKREGIELIRYRLTPTTVTLPV